MSTLLSGAMPLIRTERLWGQDRKNDAYLWESTLGEHDKKTSLSASTVSDNDKLPTDFRHVDGDKMRTGDGLVVVENGHELAVGEIFRLLVRRALKMES